MLYRWDVLEDLPALGLRAGDCLLYDPGNPARPYTICRPVDLDPGAILNQENAGALVELPVLLHPLLPASAPLPSHGCSRVTPEARARLPRRSAPRVAGRVPLLPPPRCSDP